MAKVFIPQLPTRYDKATHKYVPAIDVNPAAKFGELVVLFEHDTSPRAALAAAEARVRAEVGPGDFILGVGNVVLLAVICIHAMRKNGYATLLRWDSDSQNYETEGVKA